MTFSSPRPEVKDSALPQAPSIEKAVASTVDEMISALRLSALWEGLTFNPVRHEWEVEVYVQVGTDPDGYDEHYDLTLFTGSTVLEAVSQAFKAAMSG